MAEDGLQKLPSELQTLANLLNEQPESFALGSQVINLAALNATKLIFDLSVKSEAESRPYLIDLITSLEPSQAPRTRSQGQTVGKGKPTSIQLQPNGFFTATPLTSLLIDGMDEDQVWAQLDLRTKNICDALDFILEGRLDEGEDNAYDSEAGSDSDVEDEHLKDMLKALANGEDVDFDAHDNVDVDDSLGEDFSDASSEKDISEEDGFEDEEGVDESVMDLHDPSSRESSESDDPPMLDVLRQRNHKKYKTKRHPELDDDFFDLASFNAETERAEAKSSSKGRLGGDDSDSENISVDFFTPVGEDEESDEQDGEKDVGEAMYSDFFDPPARLPSSKPKAELLKHPPAKKSGQVRFNDQVRVKVLDKGKKPALNGLKKEYQDLDHEFGEEKSEVSEEEEDEDEVGARREIIERSKNDLFTEEIEPDLDQSTHEKRMAELGEQISILESENVGPKDWVLMGEADSRKRPQNSLLEEDLEFERAMKAVPVVTVQTVLDLEERIKSRILEGRFDDVIRLKPVEDKPFLPSRYFELKDTKSTQSLAQIYESEFVAAQSSGLAEDDRDGKLKKEHEDIDQMWEKISSKLDALCNTHFIPKQPKAIISTVSNVSTTTLESALPTTQSIATLLAPEEVFAPLAARPQARSELTPAQKRALHNRERKAKKKTRDVLEKKADKYANARSIGGVKKQKQAALEKVVKSGKGVTVVGKKLNVGPKAKDHTSR